MHQTFMQPCFVHGIFLVIILLALLVNLFIILNCPFLFSRNNPTSPTHCKQKEAEYDLYFSLTITSHLLKSADKTNKSVTKPICSKN